MPISKEEENNFKNASVQYQHMIIRTDVVSKSKLIATLFLRANVTCKIGSKIGYDM
jgi:hypothetical protein